MQNKINKIGIEPLTKRTLNRSIKLLHRVFAYHEGRRDTKKWFTASLDPEKYSRLYKKEQAAWIKYYVAVDKKTKNVVGTTGLYKMKNDPDGTFWLGWFCVDEKYRRRGLGKMLINFTIGEERKRNGKLLKLWTTDHPPMTAAHLFYKNLGFKIFKKEKIPYSKNKVIYFRLLLK